MNITTYAGAEKVIYFHLWVSDKDYCNKGIALASKGLDELFAIKALIQWF
ncbi:hypothetical protein TUM4249_35940 [Shewanella sp. KT0246]|nr:hypothetical protein TUM4249_35940 [Shewanella sp. KT0246]